MSAESLHLQYSMDIPMLLQNLLQGAARHHRQSGVVSVIDGVTYRHSYADCELRARKVAQVLGELGVKAGDRVATLAWNDHRHFELYFGVSGMGAICHTINPRLFVEQILHIVNDAQDRVIFFSPDFLQLVTQIASNCPSVVRWIMLGEPDPTLRVGGSKPLSYEALLARHDGDYAWPALDERSAAFLCYTSGTTGNPKGAVYSHRATVLHAYACALPDSHNVSAREVVMPAVPMFHANAWEAPFSATLTGARLVLPGPKLDGESLYRLIEAEGVTFAIGVPTVWFSLLRHMQERGLRFSTLRRVLLGGSATPNSMIEGYAELDVELYQGWGMTETAALTTCAQPLKSHAAMSPAERRQAIFSSAGRIVPGADMRIVDDNGEPLPWDGSTGHLQVRAPWVISHYYKASESALHDGWLPTGDLAEISSDGFMRLADRSKDLIKSGGEWISSVEIENIVAGLPGVQAAACIAAAHPKWGERPLLVIEPALGSKLVEEDILRHFEGRIATWSRPDAVLFVESIPLTATGKLFKLKLRELYGNYLMNRS
ncbi:long-chain-fatty-acid--CoA ligase [Cupriavidus sp. AcVe19-1a]|uniref:long-chain-fatty-acid--CoA ligase n=1 Tax=Cupriavidus sp. AcVe19-1a TaxID=2821359 RepID=UPI001AE5EC50|nr:long-chain-fatty-acid--CoA ligase [Cupriavidus sp. AcVe19-1a]MBP0630521.1 long-chain-fatty-acid--CoA ligase [Cupriavidus sp. AcVe19-1a]